MMYRVLLTFFIVISFSKAAPVSDDAQATIISYKNTNDGSGNYEFSYVTSNELTRSETGELVNAGQPDEHIVVRGDFSYTDPDGNLQIVYYVADENGFRILEKSPPEITPASLPAPAVASLLG